MLLRQAKGLLPLTVSLSAMNGLQSILANVRFATFDSPLFGLVAAARYGAMLSGQYLKVATITQTVAGASRPGHHCCNHYVAVINIINKTSTDGTNTSNALRAVPGHLQWPGTVKVRLLQRLNSHSENDLAA